MKNIYRGLGEFSDTILSIRYKGFEADIEIFKMDYKNMGTVRTCHINGGVDNDNLIYAFFNIITSNIWIGINN